MKYTLKEIEKMLSEISPWPWFKTGINADCSYRVKDNRGIELNTHWEGSAFFENDAKFIALSPEIISDLVEEYKDSKELVISQAQAMSSLISNLDNLKEENKRLREALEFYADSGGSTQWDGAPEIARKALIINTKENENPEGCKKCCS